MNALASVVMDLAEEADVPDLAALRSAVAVGLTSRYGIGHWSSPVSPAGVRHGLRHGHTLVARRAGRILGTLRLSTRKPWAIDPAYFTVVKRPLYLVDMAVDPSLQGKGIGRALLGEAEVVARRHPAAAIWLDAYDAPAGAGDFYRKCGYREAGRGSYRGVPLIYFERLLNAL